MPHARTIAAALLAATGIPALAQSSVTLFGAVDLDLSWGRGSIARRTQLSNSGYASSALGVRGVEDLGGAMKAGFWLEAAVSPDDGRGGATNTNNQASGAGIAAGGGQGLTFNRRSTVSLDAPWGELRLGRDYTPHYWNHVVFDPFRNKGVGTSQTIGSSLAGLTGVRASNTVGYLTPPSLGGFYAQYQHFMGENASGTASSRDGDGDSVRAGYERGPLNVAAATGRARYASGAITTWNAGASYDFGAARAMAMYDRDRVERGASGRGWLVGAEVPIGAGALRASYSTYRTDAATSPRSTKLALGYVYNLSKRTTLYVSAAQLRNGGSAAQALNGSTTAPGRSSSGADVGISHKF